MGIQNLIHSTLTLITPTYVQYMYTYKYACIVVWSSEPSNQSSDVSAAMIITVAYYGALVEVML